MEAHACVSTLLWFRRPRRMAPTMCVSHVSCPSKSAMLAASATVVLACTPHMGLMQEQAARIQPMQGHGKW